jgi:hypothetical protein
MMACMKILPRLMVVAVVAFAGSGLAGCVADADVGVAAPEVDVDVEANNGYRPPAYNGYVVYYDAQARPFYYEGGREVFVSNTYVGYRGLVAHYHAHQAAYVGWHAQYGAKYRVYRSTRVVRR